MTKDLNKEIQEIKYNHLNLPTEVLFESGDKIEWLYAADGSKLRKMVIDNGTVSEIKDYIGGFIYQKVGAQSKKLEFYSTAEGRVRNNSGTYKYEYDIKDHLGNVRVTFNEEGGSLNTKEKRDYYPFGLPFSEQGSLENKFTYNGKEWEDDFNLNWYHYGARYYDPQLGRWHSVDPVDEFHSPYVYVGNNPIVMLDPDGMGAELALENLEQGPQGLVGLAASVGYDWKLNSDDFTIGQPGFWTGLIPIYGSGRSAIDDFQNGKYVWGTINTGLAISDVFLVKSLFVGAGKLIGKTAFKTGSHTWGATRSWLGRTGQASTGQPVHHWFFQRNMGIGKYMPDAIKNQPWNLMTMESQILHNPLHGKGILTYNFLERLYFGTPQWAKTSTFYGIGRFANNTFKQP